MDIIQISQDTFFKRDISDQPLSKASLISSNTAGQDVISVDIDLPGEKVHTVYDRTANLIGAEKATDEQQLPGCKEKTGKDGEELGREEQQEVRKLRACDRKVRAHEQAHAAAGGGLVRGGPHYQYKQGPDGGSYAVAGEVSIDTSEERTPQQTIQKMQRVKAAALAPADPSGQDRAVAAAAARKAQAARSEIAQETISETSSAVDQAIQKEDSSRQAQSRAGYKKASAPGQQGKLFSIVI